MIVLQAELVDHGLTAQERDAAARHDAFLQRRSRCVHRVVDAVFALLQLDFAGGSDLDHGDAARELCQAFFELFTIVVAGGLLDLLSNQVDPALDRLFRAGTVHDRGRVLVDVDAFGAAELFQRELLELDAELVADHLAAGEDRDVFEHVLAPVTVARRLHRSGVQGAAQLVHDQGRQRFTVDVFGDDQDRLLRAGDLLEHRHQIVHVGDLLVASRM